MAEKSWKHCPAELQPGPVELRGEPVVFCIHRLFFCYNRKFFCWIAEMFLFRDHRRRGMIFGDVVSPRLVARCSFCWNRHIILLELSCVLLQSTVELFSSEFVFAGTDLFFCWKLVLFLLQLTIGAIFCY